MFGSPVIDVAIGLIFVYFLMSIITSQINEVIASLFTWRAQYLREGVRTMLADPDLANKVMAHPLIKGLEQKGKPTPYIPPNTFALALFDAIIPGGNQPTALENVRKYVATMSDNSAKRALLSILDKANGNIDQARVEVATWFNDSMERVSVIYKQQVQKVSILAALGVTLFFGVDTLGLMDTLWKEPGLRAALAGAAQAQITMPAQANNLQTTLAAFTQLALPVGWVTLPQNELEWGQKILGLILTTLAVSLGAPFWYDLLKNIVNLRSSGPAPKTQ